MADNEIQIRFTQPVVCEARHVGSGSVVRTTIAQDGTPNDSCTPSDLVATALGTCMISTMAIAAQKYGLDLSGAMVRVVEFAQRGPYRIKRFEIEFDLPVSVTERQRQSLERAAAACPVHHALHPDIEVKSVFQWNGMGEQAPGKQ